MKTNATGRTSRLSAVLLCYLVSAAYLLFSSCQNKNTAAAPVAPADATLFTVAAVQRHTGGRPDEILFNQRQQIFTCTDAAVTAQLEAARKQQVPVKVKAENGIVLQVASLTAAELQSYNDSKPPLLTATSAPVRLSASDLDNPGFDNARVLGIATDLTGCTNMVPDLATAQQLFMYCAHQACTLPGPYEVSHCIAFQYVPDGCYARAHKMRWIIENVFQYCTRKVFSYGYFPNLLSVKAGKWGGCCINWWFHVAPLICVRTPSGPQAYVIDPSMFNGPVLLSQWLKAQENPDCSATAHVSEYSIQPSEAFMPSGGIPVVLYMTDPAYSYTNSTLTSYAPLQSCP